MFKFISGHADEATEWKITEEDSMGMGLDAIGIVSKDINKSIEFYKLLGIELKKTGGPDHLEGQTPSGVRIMIDSVELTKKINPNWKEATGAGITLCFKQENPSKVNSLHAQMVEANFISVKEPWDAFWGQRYSSVQDPDGNQIDIFADLKK